MVEYMNGSQSDQVRPFAKDVQIEFTGTDLIGRLVACGFEIMID